MGYFDRIKNMLSSSTTLPTSISGGAHEHKHGSSCCGGHDHEHSHDHSHEHKHDHKEDGSCCSDGSDEDTTNPSGGCGCSS